MQEDIHSFSFIFIGDTHGFIDDFKKQKEIIKIVNPDFVLAEYLQDINLDSDEEFKNILEKKKVSEMVNFDEVKNIISLCYEKGVKLIGMDLRNFGFDTNLQEVVKGNKEPTKEDEVKIHKILETRAKHHLKIIKNYEKNSEKPIVILLGSWHLRKDSLLMKELNNYLVVYPCGLNGNLLLETPEEVTEIRYCERIK